ncbi:GAF domain-containing protein [Streptomyces sp. H39-S7]|uniref:GAF domain-containing protein n=1 Tax=Streptomyces sp. H39-S7 TaxID=3004357 RepID=UPI0022B03D02|nr:GAF domain-containing protein [Streptomyces sp. H39-S7]MCZ4124858.1 GAF domain-containing protein [Streptomyces sp. H39-S7]
MAEVLRLLHPDPWSEAGADIAVAAAEALGMDGLSVSLVTEGDRTELLWCSDDAARCFEDMQHTLGEGPGPDAVRTGAMVWVPDLAQVRTERWPALSMEAPDLQARAVYCFPLGLGAIRVGVLTAVRRTPGPMSAQQADDAIALAAVLTMRCLNGKELQAPETGAQNGANGSAETVRQPDGLPQMLNAVVHQATGMVSAQLLLPLPQALLRLRGHAYSSGRSLTEVAKDVVDRRLRLTHRSNGSPTPPPVVEKD